MQKFYVLMFNISKPIGFFIHRPDLSCCLPKSSIIYYIYAITHQARECGYIFLLYLPAPLCQNSLPSSAIWQERFSQGEDLLGVCGCGVSHTKEAMPHHHHHHQVINWLHWASRKLYSLIIIARFHGLLNFSPDNVCFLPN